MKKINFIEIAKDAIETEIVNKVDFGIFVKIYEEIDGMVHISDLTWNEKVSAITPVPGGVGPMTIACLLRNTTIAFKNKQIKSKHR